MESEPVQDYILEDRKNLRIAAAVAEAWPEAQDKIVSGFLDRLDSWLMEKLKGKGWESDWRNNGRFFVDNWSGYYLWKPVWDDQYDIKVECGAYGECMAFGVWREKSEREHCEELLIAITDKLDPSARSSTWWEAKMTMRLPASDWRKPEVLWQMHKDEHFLQAVADQLLEVAKISEPIIDRWIQKKQT